MSKMFYKFFMKDDRVYKKPYRQEVDPETNQIKEVLIADVFVEGRFEEIEISENEYRTKLAINSENNAKKKQDKMKKLKEVKEKLAKNGLSVDDISFALRNKEELKQINE